MAYPRRISDIKPLFTNLAQTSHYEVKFGGLPPELTSYLLRRGITTRFIAEDAGLLCNNGMLPTTQLATVDVPGNYIGITETFAHRRQYQDISLEFYVDKNYNSLKFLEHWMEFIASGASNPIESGGLAPINSNVNDGYFIRMQYPEYYKSNSTRIIKFDRDYKRELEYTFIGLYPYNIAPLPVSYGQSNILTMQVTFKIDRYIIGRSYSLDIANTQDNNKLPTQPNPQPQPPVVNRPNRPNQPSAPVPWPRSPGATLSNGVEFYPSNLTLVEALYGKGNK